jgi:formate-dependent nitrite reductase membrane component NrfD
MLGDRSSLVTLAAPAISIAFITLTTIVLIVDLERPERFYYILTRSNRRSWLVWGTWFLIAHGTISGAWLVAGWLEAPRAITVLAGPALLFAILATAYTGFLFAQGLGRDLWQGPHAAIDLIAQSGTVGAAGLLIAGTALDDFASPATVVVLAEILLLSLLGHLTILVFENLLSPSPTRHHELAVATIRRGAYARVFWGVAILGGGLVPLLLGAGTLAGTGLSLGLLTLAAVLALAGSAAWDYIWVEAGQSVPLS